MPNEVEAASDLAGKGDGPHILQCVGTELARHLARPLAIGLYVVATPIGNLGDMTLRAIATLARADLILAEDTRHSRTLLAHYGIRGPLQPYHEHNAERARPAVLEALAHGKAIALISDAGTPLVSDPGYKLVREVVASGHSAFALPGPSAVLAALSVAGLPTDAFHFAGFLPAKSGQRRTRLADLKGLTATLVLFEAPSRLAATLADLAEVMGPREGAVVREITKLHEQLHRGTLPELAAWAAAGRAKGEMVVLVAHATEQADVSDEDLRRELVRELATMSVRDAARLMAERTGVPRARLYDLALAIRKEAGT